MVMNLRRASEADFDRVVALQREAYAVNRTLLGVEPMPLTADYAAIFRDMEVWLADAAGGLAGVLVLQPRDSDLLIWSIAIAPGAQRNGLGRKLLEAAEERSQELGLPVMRLYTGTLLTHLVAWYARHGYAVERLETLSDRQITHMMKAIDPAS